MGNGWGTQAVRGGTPSRGRLNSLPPSGINTGRSRHWSGQFHCTFSPMAFLFSSVSSLSYSSSRSITVIHIITLNNISFFRLFIGFHYINFLLHSFISSLSVLLQFSFFSLLYPLLIEYIIIIHAIHIRYFSLLFHFCIFIVHVSGYLSTFSNQLSVFTELLHIFIISFHYCIITFFHYGPSELYNCHSSFAFFLHWLAFVYPSILLNYFISLLQYYYH